MRLEGEDLAQKLAGEIWPHRLKTKACENKHGIDYLYFLVLDYTCQFLIGHALNDKIRIFYTIFCIYPNLGAILVSLIVFKSAFFTRLRSTVSNYGVTV